MVILGIDFIYGPLMQLLCLIILNKFTNIKLYAVSRSLGRKNGFDVAEALRKYKETL